jgi:RecA/RadA recombinase
MGLKPRLIREGFRKITVPIGKSRAAFIIVSQTIENIGKSFGPRQTTAGGGGPKFIASVRIHTKRFWSETLNFYSKDAGDDKEFTGNTVVTATTIKNKLNRPYLTSVTAINNDSSVAFEGPDPDYSMLHFVFKDLIVTKPGVGYRYLKAVAVNDAVAEAARVAGLTIGVEYPFYLKQWRDFLRQYPGVRDYLAAYIDHKFKRPDMYVPEPESESDVESDASKNTDQAGSE